MPPLRYPPENLLIIGASARAAAESARRGGLRCSAIDLFADVDTCHACDQVIKVGVLDDAADRARQLDCDAFLYIGCLENRPQLLMQISQSIALAGNGPEILKKVRDPFWLQGTAVEHAFLFPGVSQSVPEPGRSVERWLRKPIRSAGGGGIQFVAARENPDQAGFYFQQYQPGDSFSATFVSNGRATKLLGITRQLNGSDLFAPTPFTYAGSIGPITLPEETTDEIERIGRVLADHTGLIGLFGMDLIVNESVPTLIEVNPRYTASMEVVERSLNTSLIAMHLMACTGTSQEHGLAVSHDSEEATVFCKLIRYWDSEQPIVTTSDLPDRAMHLKKPTDCIHDLPQPGTTIRPGHPIYTVTTSSTDFAQALAGAIKLMQISLDDETR